MSLPLYFVQDPARGVGRVAGCGWYCAPDGTLRSPQADRADALVLDDRNPLPGDFDGLIASLLAQAEAVQCEVILLDFERPPSEAARRFAGALSQKHRTAAPLPFCTGRCEPIVCYQPSGQTFSEFLDMLDRRPCWAELRPVDETVSYPVDDPPAGAGEFFSEALQCHYRAEAAENALTLRLFDTPESFSRRFSLLAPRLTAAVGLLNELQAIGFPL